MASITSPIQPGERTSPVQPSMKTLQQKNIGNLVIAALVVINVVLWLAFPPMSASRLTFTREMISGILGSSALILMASALILATRVSVLEPFFGGLDKMYRWHRRWMIGSLILFLGLLLARLDTGFSTAWIFFAVISAHVLLAYSPRIPVLRDIIRVPYSLWRMEHKVLGAVLPLGMALMALTNTPLLGSIALSAYVGAIMLAGIAAILYKVPLYGLLKRKYRYMVQSVRRLNDTTLEITLSPEARQLAYESGQFLFVSFHGDQRLAEPHPFTVSSAPHEDHVRLSVKASGDWTQYLYDHLQPGMVARVEGSYGRLNYKTGGKQQIWIAGGIGLTPFLSWMRDWNGQPSEHEIEFYYTVREPKDALFVEEIEQAAAQHGNCRAHISYSKQAGHLSIEKIMATSGSVKGKDIYLCGPIAMIDTFRRELMKRGVPAGNIHFEEFNFR